MRHANRSFWISCVLGGAYLALTLVLSLLLGWMGLLFCAMVFIVIPQIVIAMFTRAASRLLKLRRPTDDEIERLNKILELLDLDLGPEDVLIMISPEPVPTAGILSTTARIPHMFVTDLMLEKCSDQQIAVSIAHELGRFYSKDRIMTRFILTPTRFFMRLLLVPNKYGPIGRMITRTLRRAFLPLEYLWALANRKREFCADSYTVVAGCDYEVFCGLMHLLLDEFEQREGQIGRKPFQRDREGPLRTHPTITERMEHVHALTRNPA